jgi:hypothetical protein
MYAKRGRNVTKTVVLGALVYEISCRIAMMTADIRIAVNGDVLHKRPITALRIQTLRVRRNTLNDNGSRGRKNPGCQDVIESKFVQWSLILASSPYKTCLISLLLHTEF